jgi:hypothetical protein
VLLSDYVAEIDADAELDLLIGRQSRISLNHAPLDLDPAAHGGHNARELGKEAVAGVLHYPTAALLDLRINQLLEVRLQPLMRPLLILSH